MNHYKFPDKHSKSPKLRKVQLMNAGNRPGDRFQQFLR